MAQGGLPLPGQLWGGEVHPARPRQDLPQVVPGCTFALRRPNLGEAGAAPADLLTRVAGFTNNYIARLHGRTNMFATVFMAVLDPDYGQLDYLNAGHEPALVIAPDGTLTELRPTGPALGMMPDVPFTTGGMTLERGHGLLAFTDGLVEARSPSGEVYGSERLRELIRTLGPGSAEGLVTGVLEAMKGFTRQGEPHDDLTLLAATRDA